MQRVNSIFCVYTRFVDYIVQDMYRALWCGLVCVLRAVESCCSAMNSHFLVGAELARLRCVAGALGAQPVVIPRVVDGSTASAVADTLCRLRWACALHLLACRFGVCLLCCWRATLFTLLLC
jgi:hypothetical protein